MCVCGGEGGGEGSVVQVKKIRPCLLLHINLTQKYFFSVFNSECKEFNNNCPTLCTTKSYIQVLYNREHD